LWRTGSPAYPVGENRRKGTDAARLGGMAEQRLDDLGGAIQHGIEQELAVSGS
jgi:hypothetical protein